MPEEETSNQPPYDPSSMSWEGTTNYGPQIAAFERRRWETFLAQIGTSSGDAGVLGNFPQEVEQERRQEAEQELRQEVERLLASIAKKDAKHAFDTERTEDLQETVQKQEQVIESLLRNIEWRDWRIPPPSPLR